MAVDPRLLAYRRRGLVHGITTGIMLCMTLPVVVGTLRRRKT